MMRLSKKILFILLIFCCVISCSDDDQTIVLNQVGYWEVMRIDSHLINEELNYVDTLDNYFMRLDADSTGSIYQNMDTTAFTFSFPINNRILFKIDGTQEQRFHTLIEDEYEMQEWIRLYPTNVQNPDSIKSVKENFYLTRIE